MVWVELYPSGKFVLHVTSSVILKLFCAGYESGGFSIGLSGRKKSTGSLSSQDSKDKTLKRNSVSSVESSPKKSSRSSSQESQASLKQQVETTRARRECITHNL